MNGKLVKRIFKRMKIENPCDNYVKAVSIASDVIINTEKYTKDKKIAVMPMETGCGKSTITNMSLAWLVKNQWEQSGTILLKERIEDCEDTVKQINELSGWEVAAAYHSELFKKNNKYNFRQEAAYRRKLFKYPIMVMTHQGFIRRNHRLEDFLVWADDDLLLDLKNAEEPRHRTRLIVDERPATVKIVQITDESLLSIERHIQETANHEMFKPIFETCKYIRSKSFIKPADLKNQYWDKCNVTLTKEIEKFFYDKKLTSDEILEIYNALKVFCKIGGFVNYSRESEFLNVTVGLQIEIFDKIFDSIILDGTARINTLYKNERFNMINVPQFKSYKNVRICICKQLNGSKNELRAHHDIIPTVLSYIRSHKPKEEDALIITLKSFEQEFINHGLPPRTKINHFGNITGTNKYVKCKHLYIIGVPYLPDNAYKIAYHNYSGDLKMNKDQESVTVSGVRMMVDADYRETSVSMISCELVQAINRVRCRTWVGGDTLDTTIFMLNRDDSVIGMIEECMPGVNILDGFDFFDGLSEEAKRKKHRSTVDVVLSTLSKHKQLFAEAKVKKNEIFNAHELTETLAKAARAAVWKHPAIQQLVSDGKINLYNHYIEFLD